MSKRILIIPPTTETSVRKRLREIGLGLSRHYKIYMLHWHEPKRKDFIERIGVTLKDIFKKSRIYKKEGITYAEFPIFHRPFSIIKLYNPYSLNHFIIKHNIDVVINGIQYFFFTPENKRHTYKHIFDINDLPARETASHLGRFSYEFAKHETQKANAVTTCSQGLVDYIKEHFNCNAHFIPNGTYLDEFHNMDYETVKKIRQKYNLLNKFVIGYIGFIGDWIDIDFLISFFDALKKKYTDAALMIVGSGSNIDLYRDKIKDKDIIFTGGIPREAITPYFFSIDAAVLPSKKNLFQDLAFHTKLIEYTAAKKMVISSPLEEVMRLGFPNILIANLSIDEWLSAFDKIRQSRWNSGWNKLVEVYDWDILAAKLHNIIENLNKR